MHELSPWIASLLAAVVAVNIFALVFLIIYGLAHLWERKYKEEDQ